MNIKMLLSILLLTSAVGSIAACDMNEGPFEEAGENVQDAVDNTGDAIEDAGDNIEDKM